jgi:hypothetical protein
MELIMEDVALNNGRPGINQWYILVGNHSLIMSWVENIPGIGVFGQAIRI